MKVMFSSKFLLMAIGLVLFGQAVGAQNSIKLFSPINIRSSPSSASYQTPYSFGSSTVSLSCESGATATLSGLNNGNLLVDNNILVTVTQGAVSNGPTNVCTGGDVSDNESTGSLANNCFLGTWPGAYPELQSAGQSPDDFAGTYGVAPLLMVDNANNNANLLTNLNFDYSKPLNFTVSLEDEGVVLASSSIVLTTSCQINGVTGPSTVSGNPITGDNGKTQNFSFNPLPNKGVDFTYDVGGVTNFSGGPNGSIPQTTDSPIDPSKFRPDWVAKTPFATSSCFVHFGEVLEDGSTKACKLYALECISVDGSTVAGANCPKSSASDEKVVDHFDGPALMGLPNIYNTAGQLVAREGVGFLMASENWAPALPAPAGQCNFEPASGLSGVACPQNLLRDFSGPGAFSGTGLTTNPNSTFISIYGVPQPLTRVNLQGAKANNWVDTNQPQLGFNSTPPNFTKGANTIDPVFGIPVPLNGAANFIPAPIKSITFGISSASDPLPTPVQEPALAATDRIVANKTCPTSFTALTQPSFGPAKQTISKLPDGTTPIPDGKYLVHYYAQDCAGTQELQFTTHGTINEEPVWATSFYTIPVNIDTTKPVVTITNVVGPYVKLNSTVYAQFYCTDAQSGSGVTHCGSNSFATESIYDTGILKMKINTSSLGQKTLTITAVDGAGNSNFKSVNYTVTK